MAFSYQVDLSDPGNLGGSANDALLVTDLEAALKYYAEYITGLGTLVVSLVIGTSPIGTADGGPTDEVPIGTTASGIELLEPSSLYELTTGTHYDGDASDITIDVDPSFISSLYLDPDPTPTGTPPVEKEDAFSVLVHELTHGFGMVGEYDNDGTLLTQDGQTYESTFDADVQISADGTADFVGANAEAVYGGPLPLTTDSATENYYHFADAETEPLGLDVMSGLGLYEGARYSISAADRAVLKDLGYDITLAAPTATPQITAINFAASSQGYAVSGTASPGQLLRLSNFGTAGNMTTAGNSGGWSSSGTLSYVQNRIYVAAVDGAGLAVATSSTLIVSQDAISDTVLADTGPLAIDGGGEEVLFTGGDSDASAVGGSITVTDTPRLVANLDRGDWLLSATGSNTIVNLGSGSDSVIATGTEAIHGSTGTATIADKGSNDTITGGTGAASVFGQGSHLHLEGGGGPLLFVDTTGGNTVTGGSSGLVVFGSATGSDYQAPDNYFLFTSGGGDDTITAEAGTKAPVVFGSPGGRVHIAAVPGAFVVAGTGSETIDASGSSGAVTFFGDGGATDLIGGSGSNFYEVSTGPMTLSGGNGNIYEFSDGHAGSTDLITDFTAYDGLYLQGYGTGATSGIASETVVNGQLNMSLTDGTLIVFKNLTSASQLDGKIHHI